MTANFAAWTASRRDGHRGDAVGAHSAMAINHAVAFALIRRAP